VIVQRRKSQCRCLMLLLSIATGLSAHSQQVPSSAPVPLKFDVVSVKPDKSEHPVRIHDSGEGNDLSFSNMTPSSIILYAFDIQDPHLLLGSPRWADSLRYDIEAKVAAEDLQAFHALTREQRRLLLQNLLSDRFKMRYHREPKETSIFALVLSKSSSNLKLVQPNTVRTSGIQKPDGSVLQGEILHSRMPGQIEAQEVPMDTFARSLSGFVGRQVVDKTGLAGVYDFKLEWQPDRDLDRDAAGREVSAPTQDEKPSLFRALQEQLGLKLSSEKVMMPSLVIDQLEEPSDN
jgi:uncharacterized protein (TIGR03435 family)